MIRLFKNHQKEPTEIFTHFKKYDQREMNIRGKINAIIKTGLYEIAKTQQEEKRRNYEQDLEQKKNIQMIEDMESNIHIIKTKASQKQKKKK